MYPLDDTIVAIASPPGGGARGIVRLSGPGAASCLRKYFEAGGDAQWTEALRPQAITGSLELPGMASRLPCDVYLWPDGRSYTGQPVAEIHTLGCQPLLDAVLRACCMAGARMAQRGEFTLRAFLAGRLDLTQAEAVLGVIDAADPNELDVALAQLAGGLAGPLHGLRDALVDLLAQLEAGFDFPDEELPPVDSVELDRQLGEAACSVARLARQMDSRSETADGARVVLVGLPNTGKSSLFNALTRGANALVFDRPGTTRDYLTAELDLDGVRCQLIDTAGVADGMAGPAGDVHQLAQAASTQQAQRAHVRILCLDSTRPLYDWERVELGHRCALPQPPQNSLATHGLVALTKIDVGRETHLAGRAVRTSSVTGEGIDALRRELRRAVLDAGTSGVGVVAGTAARCRESLRLAAECLKRAQEIVHNGHGEELVAAEVRVALDELGKVVGAVHTDDVLDRVFSRFCIGK